MNPYCSFNYKTQTQFAGLNSVSGNNRQLELTEIGRKNETVLVYTN
jgi:hypothetical protein